MSNAVLHQGMPPGPRGLGVFSTLLAWQRNGLASLETLTRQYGDIVSIKLMGKRIFLLNHPGYINHVLVENHDNYLKTKGNVNAQRYFGDSMQLNNGDFARRLRRLMTPLFPQGRVNREYCLPTVEVTEEVIAKWSIGPRPDLTKELLDLALLVAVRIHFGTKSGQDTEQLAALFRNALTLLNQFLPPDWIPGGASRRYQKAIAELDKEVMCRIQERRAVSAGTDLLSCLAALDADGKPAMTNLEIRHELVSMMAAGYQTIGIAINQTLRLLAQNPHADEQLAQEITRVLDGRSIQVDDIAGLSYAEQVVKESLRCAPPAGALARLVAKDDTVGGYTIPAKSQVFVSSWLMHRDPRFYKDPLQFRPERWTPQLERELPLCAYFPFGRGARSCLAGALSSTVLKIMLVTIMQRFRPQLAEPATAGEPRPFDRGDVPIVLEPRGVSRGAASSSSH